MWSSTHTHILTSISHTHWHTHILTHTDIHTHADMHTGEALDAPNQYQPEDRAHCQPPTVRLAACGCLVHTDQTRSLCGCLACSPSVAHEQVATLVSGAAHIHNVQQHVSINQVVQECVPCKTIAAKLSKCDGTQ